MHPFFTVAHQLTKMPGQSSLGGAGPVSTGTRQKLLTNPWTSVPSTEMISPDASHLSNKPMSVTSMRIRLNNEPLSASYVPPKNTIPETALRAGRLTPLTCPCCLACWGWHQPAEGPLRSGPSQTSRLPSVSLHCTRPQGATVSPGHPT